ncbi:MAG: hypothetical protein ACJZ72_01025 [Opitutales bacterium]
MPFRMFVTVDYVGDGSDQPDWKAATQSVELLKSLKKENKPFFLATGLVSATLPECRPPNSISNPILSRIWSFPMCLKMTGKTCLTRVSHSLTH